MWQKTQQGISCQILTHATNYWCFHACTFVFHVWVCVTQCDETLSQPNCKRSVLAVGCCFGQPAIPLCHCGHSGVQPADGSHTLAHSPRNSNTHAHKKSTQATSKHTYRRTKITPQLHAPANTQEHRQTNHAYTLEHTQTHTNRAHVQWGVHYSNRFTRFCCRPSVKREDLKGQLLLSLCLTLSLSLSHTHTVTQTCN